MTFLTLENPIRWLFLAHAIAGALALLVLIIPLISKKGGKLHVQTGWIYTGAMIFVWTLCIHHYSLAYIL